LASATVAVAVEDLGIAIFLSMLAAFSTVVESLSTYPERAEALAFQTSSKSLELGIPLVPLVTPAEHPQALIQRGQPVNRARILLADDNELLLELTARMLATSFDVVGLARDGQDLIAKARKFTPDVIIVDITMPLVTGIEAVHELRQDGSSARFVFLTVHQESEFLQACLEEGALGYVIKSHIKADLIPAIQAVMAGERFVSPSLSLSEDAP
jgi:CheY-like chemotaxis protein